MNIDDQFKSYQQSVEESVRYLSATLPVIPEVAIVLGTGLGAIVDELDTLKVIPYSDIPGFPVCTGISHDGNLVYGRLGQREILVLQGRFHFYEGYSARELTLPVRVLGLLGVKNLFLTNAAGGLNPDFRSGHIMIIEDHINLIGDNPLRGPNVEGWGERFPDMSRAYDRRLIDICRNAARELELANITSGVYCAVPGPSLETAAETRYLKMCGADAVGMSTVPEVIVACHCQMSVLGLSVIANINDPDNFQPIEVGDILDKMKSAASDISVLLEKVINAI